MQQEQKQLLDQFYISCRGLLGPLRLSPGDYRELIAKLEQHYIDDGQKGVPQLELKTFRDLPNLVKVEHADLLRRRAKDGEFPEYYPGGAMKTRWRFKEGKPDGAIVTYYENGDILYIDHYREGEKISRRKYDKEGKMEFEQAYDYGPVTPPVVSSAPDKPAESA
jgi:antitoxin component YwqK of YwqJK toxin-antitoxin module